MNRHLLDLKDISNAKTYQASVAKLLHALRNNHGFKSVILWQPDAANTTLNTYTQTSNIEVSLQDTNNPLVLSYINKEIYNLSYSQLHQSTSLYFTALVNTLAIRNGTTFVPLKYADKRAPLGVIMAQTSAADAPETSESFSLFSSIVSQILYDKYQLDSLKHDTIYFSDQAKKLRESADTIRKIDHISERFVGISQFSRNIRAEITNSSFHSFNYFISGHKGTGKLHIAKLIHAISKGRAENLYIIEPNTDILKEISKVITVCMNSQKKSALVIKNSHLLSASNQKSLLELINSKQELLSNSSVSNYRIMFIYDSPVQQLLTTEKLISEFYFQLKQVEIKTVELAQRSEDVPFLLVDFISRQMSLSKDQIAAYDIKQMRFLNTHSWGGNADELYNFSKICAANLTRKDSFQPRIIQDLLSQWPPKEDPDIGVNSNKLEDIQDDKLEAPKPEVIQDDNLKPPKPEVIQDDNLELPEPEVIQEDNLELPEPEVIEDDKLEPPKPEELPINSSEFSLANATKEFQKKVIQQRLALYNGSKVKTAKSLNIPRSTFATKCKKLGLTK